MEKIFKDKYKKIFCIVREELNKIDPIGVVKYNSNLVDEYDMENQMIIPLINDYSDYKEFAKKICEILTNATGEQLQPENCYECAKNILDKSKIL